MRVNSFVKICFFVMVLTIALPLFAHDYTLPGGQTPDTQPKHLSIWDKILKYLGIGGDPVHLKSGEFYLSTTEMVVQGRTIGIAIERHYSSRSEYNSRFGYGWDMNYNIKVRKLHDPNTLVLLTGQNRVLDYTLDPNSNPSEPVYMAPAGLYDYIVENENGTFTLVGKHGTMLDFDINGNLTTITDRNNNTITFTYDPNGLLPLNGPSDYFVGQSYGLIAREYKLTKITNDLGWDINFIYDSDGLLTTVTDFAGRNWTYSYDPYTNDLLTVTGPSTTDYPSGLTTTYTYDPNHNLLTATDANNQTYLTNVYDSNDFVTSQTYGDGSYTFSYEPDSNEVMVTDRRGFSTTTVYNSTGNPLSVTIDTNNLRVGDPESYTTSYEYNSNIEIVKKTFPAGNWIEYTYDTNGNVLSVCREPNNGDANIVTTYTYDPNFNFVKTVADPLGNVTTYDYNDINGNLEKITFPTVSTPGGNKAPVVTFTYNPHGQVETVTAPDGIITKYVYYGDANDANNYGWLWKVIVDANESDPNRLEITTTYKYDILGHVIEVNDPNGDTTSLAYNNLDQLTQSTAPSPYSFETNFSYNNCKKLSQVTRVRTGGDQVTSYTYNIMDKIKTITDPLNNVTTTDYDHSENLSSMTDAENNQTQYSYDERDLLWKTTDANGNITEYSYDDNSNLKEIKDPNGDKTTYTYDGFDRLTCITYPNDTNEVFGYDAVFNLTSRKNRKGETIYYEYDAMNRLIVKSRPGDPNITFLYDINGRIWDVNDGGDITEYYYDRIGRVIDVNDPEDRRVSYEYDSKGLRTWIIYPDDSYITYEYDALGQIRRIKDDSNNVLAEYEYDELSRRTRVTLGNDSNAVYEYDMGNRLTKLTNNINATDSIVFEYSNYDKVGNRLSMKIDDANTHVYTYDELYQLTFVDYNDSNSTSYTYDSLGNRTDVIDGSSITYVRNCLNQYTSVGGTSYSYDNNGNLTDDGLFKYYFDCENRLIDINDQNDAAVASYSYDYLGRRVSKTVYGSPDVTTKYCYDGDQVIAEYDNSSNLLRRYVYGPGIDEPICMIDVAGGNAVYYYHFDGLGSIIALSNSSGNVVERYSYDVFGEPNRVSDVNNPYMFTGRAYDTETGLYYYRARYYDPYIGRFLHVDPIGYADSMNLYIYAGNNPIVMIDPLGLCGESSGWSDRFNDFLENTNEYYDAWAQISHELFRWFSGLSPERISIDPSSPFGNVMRNHYGVSIARQDYLNQNLGRSRSNFEPYRYSCEFGFLQYINPLEFVHPRHALGEYEVHFEPYGDIEKVTITQKWNYRSLMRSFNYIPIRPKYMPIQNLMFDITRQAAWDKSTFPPMANTYTDIVWYENSGLY